MLYRSNQKKFLTRSSAVQLRNTWKPVSVFYPQSNPYPFRDWDCGKTLLRSNLDCGKTFNFCLFVVGLPKAQTSNVCAAPGYDDGPL